jgi:hypothetical protein
MIVKIICTLSILFTITVLGGLGYLYFADPFGVNALLFPQKNSIPTTSQNININSNANTSVNTSGLTSEAPINLSADQKASLEKIGIDPNTVPDAISPEVEGCFVEKLGQQRVDEIKAGSSPGALDLLRAKPCLE